MSILTTIHQSASGLKRVPVAVTISLASVGLIAVAFATVRRPETARPNTAAAENPVSKPSTPWNLALGNVVVLAPELGLKTAARDNAKIEPARLAARIEAQLTPLRRLYREHSESDPTLLGGITLQLTVGNSGLIEDVAILSAQLHDGDFRKAVAAEAEKWNFNEIAPEGTVIECPLLFVREGMDIATVVNWEKALRSLRDQQVSAKSARPQRTTKKQ
jgi:hypothetical protein